jgi:NADH-quinone oxidoreductase subunit G
MIHSVDDDWLMNVKNKLVVAPAQICAALDGVLAALDDGAADDAAKAIAASLKSGNNSALWIGNLAAQSADAAQIHARVQAIAHRLGELKADAKVRIGFIGEAANSVGGHIARVTPGEGGKNARQMFEQPLKAYVLLHAEPALDTAYPAQALKALADADLVVVMSPFKHSLDVADVLLPIAPFTETAGTFVNTEGLAQSFNGVVRPLGDTRPAWKVLRVLGNILELAGFEQDTPEAVRAECLPADITAKLNNHTQVSVQKVAAPAAGYQRIADVPIYFADALVRRAESLQLTADSKAPRAWLHGDELQKLGVAEGGQVKLRNGSGDVTLAAARDDRLPAGCVRVSGAHPSTLNAGPLAGVLLVERA